MGYSSIHSAVINTAFFVIYSTRKPHIHGKIPSANDKRILVKMSASISPLSDEILIDFLGVAGAGKSFFINRATVYDTLEVGHNICSCLFPLPCIVVFSGERV